MAKRIYINALAGSDGYYYTPILGTSLGFEPGMYLAGKFFRRHAPIPHIPGNKSRMGKFVVGSKTYAGIFEVHSFDVYILVGMREE